MKYVVDMGSGVMICTPCFIKIGSGVQKLMGEIHSMVIAKSNFYFFQNKESRLTIYI
jgi:hypothetical protein